MFALLLILGIGFGFNQRTCRSAHYGVNGLHVKTAPNEGYNKLREKHRILPGGRYIDN